MWGPDQRDRQVRLDDGDDHGHVGAAQVRGREQEEHHGRARRRRAVRLAFRVRGLRLIDRSDAGTDPALVFKAHRQIRRSYLRLIDRSEAGRRRSIMAAHVAGAPCAYR